MPLQANSWYERGRGGEEKNVKCERLSRVNQRDEVTHLFACLDDLLLVVGLGDALDGGQGFSATSLLYPNMYQTVLNALIITLRGIEKGICGQRMDQDYGQLQREGLVFVCQKTQMKAEQLTELG